MRTLPQTRNHIKVRGINPSWDQRAVFYPARGYSVQAYSNQAAKWYHVRWVKAHELDGLLQD